MIFSRACDWPKTAQRRDRSLVQINRITIHLKTIMDFHRNTPKTSCLSCLKLGHKIKSRISHLSQASSRSSQSQQQAATWLRCPCLFMYSQQHKTASSSSTFLACLFITESPAACQSFKKKGNEFEESEKLQMIKGKGNVLSENTFT